MDKPTLIADLLAVFEFESGQEVNPEESRQRIATGLANAIEKFVKTGKPKYTTGLVAGNTAVTGNFNGSIE